MIICMRAKRKEDGTIDPAGTKNIRAVRKADVSEVVQEDGGKVLVRVDGEPADYWDGVVIDGHVVVSDEMKSTVEDTKPAAEPPKRKRGRPRKNE